MGWGSLLLHHLPSPGACRRRGEAAAPRDRRGGEGLSLAASCAERERARWREVWGEEGAEVWVGGRIEREAEGLVTHRLSLLEASAG